MQIDLWFLILALVFPRIALFGAWCFGGMPAHNGVPFWLCLLGSVFFARILVCVFVAINLGTSSPWFMAHAIFAILGYIAGAIRVSRKSSK